MNVLERPIVTREITTTTKSTQFTAARVHIRNLSSKLPLEARHTISLEMARKRRLSVQKAQSIFIPKYMGGRCERVAENGNNPLTKQQKTTAAKAAKCNTKKLPLSILKHPQSFPIRRPSLIPNIELRSVVDGLRELKSKTSTSNHLDESTQTDTWQSIGDTQLTTESTLTPCAPDMPDLDLFDCIKSTKSNNENERLTIVKVESVGDDCIINTDDNVMFEEQEEFIYCTAPVCSIETEDQVKIEMKENSKTLPLLTNPIESSTNKLKQLLEPLKLVNIEVITIDDDDDACDDNDGKIEEEEFIYCDNSLSSTATAPPTVTVCAIETKNQARIKVKENLIAMPLQSDTKNIIMDLSLSTCHNLTKFNSSTGNEPNDGNSSDVTQLNVKNSGGYTNWPLTVSSQPLKGDQSGMMLQPLQLQSHNRQPKTPTLQLTQNPQQLEQDQQQQSPPPQELQQLPQLPQLHKQCQQRLQQPQLLPQQWSQLQQRHKLLPQLQLNQYQRPIQQPQHQQSLLQQSVHQIPQQLQQQQMNQPLPQLLQQQLRQQQSQPQKQQHIQPHHLLSRLRAQYQQPQLQSTRQQKQQRHQSLHLQQDQSQSQKQQQPQLPHQLLSKTPPQNHQESLQQRQPPQFLQSLHQSQHKLSQHYTMDQLVPQYFPDLNRLTPSLQFTPPTSVCSICPSVCSESAIYASLNPTPLFVSAGSNAHTQFMSTYLMASGNQHPHQHIHHHSIFSLQQQQTYQKQQQQQRPQQKHQEPVFRTAVNPLFSLPTASPSQLACHATPSLTPSPPPLHSIPPLTTVLHLTTPKAANLNKNQHPYTTRRSQYYSPTSPPRRPPIHLIRSAAATAIAPNAAYQPTPLNNPHLPLSLPPSSTPLQQQPQQQCWESAPASLAIRPWYREPLSCFTHASASHCLPPYM